MPQFAARFCISAGLPPIIRRSSIRMILLAFSRLGIRVREAIGD
jgi:hypothetical protein